MSRFLRFLPEDAWIKMTRSLSRTVDGKVLATDVEVASRQLWALALVQ